MKTLFPTCSLNSSNQTSALILMSRRSDSWCHQMFSNTVVLLSHINTTGGCGSGVEPASCYLKVAGLIPWSACWSVLGQDTGPQTGPGVLVSHGSRLHHCANEWLNDFQSLWTEESDNLIHSFTVGCWRNIFSTSGFLPVRGSSVCSALSSPAGWREETPRRRRRRRRQMVRQERRSNEEVTTFTQSSITVGVFRDSCMLTSLPGDSKDVCQSWRSPGGVLEESWRSPGEYECVCSDRLRTLQTWLTMCRPGSEHVDSTSCCLSPHFLFGLIDSNASWQESFFFDSVVVCHSVSLKRTSLFVKTLFTVQNVFLNINMFLIKKRLFFLLLKVIFCVLTRILFPVIIMLSLSWLVHPQYCSDAVLLLHFVLYCCRSANSVSIR